MSKSNMKFAAVSAAALASLAAMALPGIAAAQSNGITSCDAPGGRQRTGAAIGAVLGGLAGSQISDNERTLGAVVGAGAGAAAGSYIGCNQQRARANSRASAGSSGAVYATTTLRVRSGPGTNYRQTGSVTRGQALTPVTSQGEWVQLAGGGWVNANYLRR